jgi:hypothetical protein
MATPFDVTVSIATGLATNAIIAAASRSRQFVARTLSNKKVQSKLRQIDKLIADHQDSEVDVRSYLSSIPAQKIFTSLAYLAALDETEGSRVTELGVLFTDDICRSCPTVNEKYAEQIWNRVAAALNLVFEEMKDGGELNLDDIYAAQGLFGETRKDARTGRPIGALQSSFARRAEVMADASRVQKIYEAIEVIRARVAEDRKFIELPHLREQHRVPMDDLYIQRDLAAFGVSEAKPLQWWSPAERLPPRLVILGNPGVGKSTYVSQMLYQTAASSVSSPSRIAPLLLSLRDYDAAQEDRSFASWLADNIESVYQFPIAKSTVEDIFSLGLALVVFDGLDEIIDLSKRRSTAARIAHFCQQYPSCDVIVTSREVGYRSAALDKALFVEVALPEFLEDQIVEYVRKWFAETSREGEDASALADHFMTESIYAKELLPNPLMLSLLCSVYQYIGYIPENRPALYEECSRLLFYRWDKIRRIDASSWKEAKLLSMVQELAGFFFRVQSAQSGVPERQLKKIIKNYLQDNVLSDPDEAEDQADDFVDYCSGRAWVISKIGTAKGERLFGFTHRTFMEYFAAKSIVRECSNAMELVERLRPIIGNSQSEIIPEIALQIYEEQGTIGRADEFLNLLLYGSKFGGEVDGRYLWFGLKALQFVSVKPVTASRVFISSVSAWARNPDYYTNLPQMILAVASDTASNFRSSLSRVCTSVLRGSENPLVLIPFQKFATRMLTFIEDGNAWSPVLNGVLEAYGQSLDEIIRMDPEYATQLVLQGEISLKQFVQFHGVSGLLAFKLGTTIHPGASVRVVTDSLLGTDKHLDIVSEIVGRFNKIERCDSSMYTLWLDMVIKSISKTLGTYPRIFRSNVGVLLFLVCLASIEEERGPDGVPAVIRQVIKNWVGLDIVEIAARARWSDYASSRVGACESIVNALRTRRVGLRSQKLVQNWVVDSVSLRGQV